MDAMEQQGKEQGQLTGSCQCWIQIASARAHDDPGDLPCEWQRYPGQHRHPGDDLEECKRWNDTVSDHHPYYIVDAGCFFSETYRQGYFSGFFVGLDISQIIDNQEIDHE